MTNHERVGKALELLKAGLGPFVDREMQRAIKAQRVGAAALRSFVDDPNVGDRPLTEWDAAALLKLMWETWNEAFRAILGPAERGFVGELRGHRNRWAHQEPFSGADAYRALDTAGRLLTAVSAPQAAAVDRLKMEQMELLRVRSDEQVRGERHGHADRSEEGTGHPVTSTTDNERPNVWVVRADRGRYAEHFVANGYAGVGCLDVSSARDRDEIRRLCEQAHPDWDARRIGNYTGQYYDFLFRIRDGDYVLTPELDAGRLRYGRVVGPGESAAGDDGCPYRNRRAVDWNPASFSRGRLSKSLRKTLQRPPTVFPVPQREEFRDAVGLSGAAPRGQEHRRGGD